MMRVQSIINGMARVHAANLEQVEKCEDGDYPRCRNVLGAYYCEKCGQDVRVTEGACSSVPLSERWKVNYSESAESWLAKTFFVVKATSFEQQCLWEEHAEDSYRRFSYRKWEQVNSVGVFPVGELDSRTICVSMRWVQIDGHLVMFWEATSQVVDLVKIEKWLERHFTGTWCNGTRQATTNAANFHHCLNAIDEANKSTHEEK
jgi:hypothetical protein